jgi:hypothetical protein
MRNDHHQHVATADLLHACRIWWLQRLGFEILHHHGLESGLARRFGRGFAVLCQVLGGGGDEDNWLGNGHVTARRISPSSTFSNSWQYEI